MKRDDWMPASAGAHAALAHRRPMAWPVPVHESSHARRKAHHGLCALAAMLFLCGTAAAAPWPAAQPRAGGPSEPGGALAAGLGPEEAADARLYGGNTFWVSTVGSDSNSCLAENTAECASLQKVLGLVGPGDRIYIKPGTYVENSLASAYTAACYWFNGLGSWCIKASGTPTNPILISAAPGSARGSVILDNQNSRVGFVMQAHDYVTFRGLTIRNSVKNAIANGSQAGNAVPDIPLLSIGVVVEDCLLKTVTTPDSGDNIAAIGMWATKDWIVRNNVIEGVPTGSGIRAYGVINALIEHNTISDVSSGVMWKDHFVQDLATRQHVFESEIRYNLITAADYGVLIQIRGDGTPEAGDNYIHHNVFTGLTNGEPAGLRFAMAGAYAQSGEQRFEHNLVDCRDAATPVGITLDSSDDARLRGNIFVNCGLPIEAIKYSSTIYANLTQSDFNLFVGDFGAVMDRYSASSIFYPTLSAWQGALNSSSFSLGFDHPDLNSRTVAYSSSLFSASNPFMHSATSPANGMMADGSNAGPYQIGNEQIGAFWPDTLLPAIFSNGFE